MLIRRAERPVVSRGSDGALVHVLIGVWLSCLLLGCGRAPSSAPGVRIWHWMTDREEAFEELARRYQAQTTIPVRFELYAPSDLYVQKVRAAAQTDGLPDVFGILGERRDLASFISAGYVLRLSDVMEENFSAWQQQFFPIALAMNAFGKDNLYGVPPGVYGVPIDVMSVQICYNKRLLAQLGLDPKQPPATWDEFLALGPRVQQAGLIGFVSGWAELWLIDCFANSYAVHLMGQERVADTFRGRLPYTDRRWLQMLELFVQLRDSGLLAQDIVTMGNKRAEQLFANEQAVFALNGTWGVNVYQGMNPDLDYGVMMLPAVRRDRAMVTWGGAGSSFMVNAKSPKAAQAVAFLQWLTGDAQQAYLLDMTHNIPANRQVVQRLQAEGVFPPLLGAFVDDMDRLVHPRLLDVQEHSLVIEALNKGIQAIVIGEQTPQRVAQTVQEIKRREDERTAP